MEEGDTGMAFTAGALTRAPRLPRGGEVLDEGRRRGTRRSPAPSSPTSSPPHPPPSPPLATPPARSAERRRRRPSPSPITPAKRGDQIWQRRRPSLEPRRADTVEHPTAAPNAAPSPRRPRCHDLAVSPPSSPRPRRGEVI
ncbi:hypothetical protein OsI_18640 [Oryza sativa Indica Group]|uniref:Uncharacterized protein n=1 Tax=Oryza sativa subsp. indica TaxID=39946 RepID=B8AYL7_ORYSI|nr:hypothetical protein OsI_18640 [Oryza sativa Indica Group]